MEMEFGSHVLEIDAEATRAYYRAHPESCSRDSAHRNYARWLNSLTGGEGALFRALGIDDHCQCAMMGCYARGDGKLIRVTATYIVAGRVIREPESRRTVADWIPKVGAGEVELYLAREGSLFAESLPADRFPGGQLFLSLMKEIPWVLDEPCRLPTREQLLEAAGAASEAAIAGDLRSLLEATRQPYGAIDTAEAEKLKARIIESYVESASLPMARGVCHTDGRGARAFLWHIFSYGLAPSVEGDAAREQYARLRAADYYVYLEGYDLCFRVAGGRLPDLGAMEELPDTYVISGSLDWIYAHTHEEDLYGPYLSLRP